MEIARLFLDIFLWIAVISLLAGMVKPWWVLWFLDYQNRLRVIKIYGTAAVVLLLIKLLLLTL